jgi:hypothetical protein
LKGRNKKIEEKSFKYNFEVLISDPEEFYKFQDGSPYPDMLTIV